MLEDKRIIGDAVEINPEYKDCKLLYVTTETHRNKNHFERNPSFWLDYKGVLYHCICDYDMEPFEMFEDWDMGGDNRFNEFFPGEKEFEFLMNMKPTFYKVVFSIIQNYLDHFSQWELDLCKPYERQNKIDNILK